MHYNNAVYYVPGAKPPSSLNAEALSHIFYASADVTRQGEVLVGDATLDIEQEIDGVTGYIRACTALRSKRNKKLKILLSVGVGDSGGFNARRAASNETMRTTFVQSAKTLVNKFELDGLDLNWDFLESNQSENADYAQLVGDLREGLPRGKYVLSTTLPGNIYTLMKHHLQRISNHVDFINLKCFDFSGSWSSATAHNSQLYDSQLHYAPVGSQTTCKSLLEIVIMRHRVEARKVMIGIPTYGLAFSGSATSVGQPFERCTIVPYNELPSPGTHELLDEQAMAVFCHSGKDGFVSYDNPTTVKLKADFIKHHSMGGLFFWEASKDLDGHRSLITAGLRCLAP